MLFVQGNHTQQISTFSQITKMPTKMSVILNKKWLTRESQSILLATDKTDSRNITRPCIFFFYIQFDSNSLLYIHVLKLGVRYVLKTEVTFTAGVFLFIYPNSITSLFLMIEWEQKKKKQHSREFPKSYRMTHGWKRVRDGQWNKECEDQKQLEYENKR